MERAGERMKRAGLVCKTEKGGRKEEAKEFERDEESE